MHVLFEAVYADINLINHRPDGLDFNELAYADDTALITPSVRAMNKLLKSIEEKAVVYSSTKLNVCLFLLTLTNNPSLRMGIPSLLTIKLCI